MAHLQKMPVINPNDEKVFLSEWLKQEDEKVEEGEPICVVETSKAVEEVEAEKDGFVVPIAEEENDVKIQDPLVVIKETPEEDVKDLIEKKAVKKDSSTTKSEERGWTKKAEILAKKHDIDLTEAQVEGVIKENEVKEFIEQEKRSEFQDSLPNWADVNLPDNIDRKDLTLPTLVSNPPDNGYVSTDLLERIEDDPKAFGDLRSEEKCNIYRKNGAKIGQNVEIGKGTIINSQRIVIEDEAKIGKDSKVNCEEAFYMGKLAHLGPSFEAKCQRAILGQEIYGGSNIQVGGGGNQDPDAWIIVGDLTYLGDDLFLNTCRPIIVGQSSFITQRSQVVTHNIGHSILEGYENRFEPVVLGDKVQVGMNCVVYAGVSIGKATIVGSNSYVATSLPKDKYAVGVPAQVVKDASRSLSNKEKSNISKEILEDLLKLLRKKGYEAKRLASSKTGFKLPYDKQLFGLLFIESFGANTEVRLDLSKYDELIILTLNYLAESDGKGIVIDLLDKKIYNSKNQGGIFLDSVREFLRKKGIRLSPRPWRYSQGLI